MADDLRHSKILDYYRSRARDALQVWDRTPIPQVSAACEIASALKNLLLEMDESDRRGDGDV